MKALVNKVRKNYKPLRPSTLTIKKKHNKLWKYLRAKNKQKKKKKTLFKLSMKKI